MANPAVLKVFHAARQDVEIFVHQADAVPAPLFDTQIAAMVCGFGDAVSYDRRVRSVTGVRIDTTSRLTDGGHTPIGRAACRERVWPSGWVSVVAVSITNTKAHSKATQRETHTKT